MNRRSFLQFLGVAPFVAPAAFAALPPSAIITDFGRMTPEAAAAAVDLYGTSQMAESIPMLRQWNELLARDFANKEFLVSGGFLDELDRVSPALRT